MIHLKIVQTNHDEPWIMLVWCVCLNVLSSGTLIYDQLLQSFINWGLDNLRVASYELIVCKLKLRVRVEICELRDGKCELILQIASWKMQVASWKV